MGEDLVGGQVLYSVGFGYDLEDYGDTVSGRKWSTRTGWVGTLGSDLSNDGPRLVFLSSPLRVLSSVPFSPQGTVSGKR